MGLRAEHEHVALVRRERLVAGRLAGPRAGGVDHDAGLDRPARRHDARPRAGSIDVDRRVEHERTPAGHRAEQRRHVDHAVAGHPQRARDRQPARCRPGAATTAPP